MSGFFDQIVYSSANEDGRSELRALDGASSVVTIAGSGARAFDLLLGQAREVTAVDFNQHQLHLVALKVAAYQTLTHAEGLPFLGVTSGDRANTYRLRVRDALEPNDRAYWDERPQLIAGGVIYAGVWERLFRLFAFAARAKGAALARLFAATTLAEQRRLWAEWDDWRWRLGLRVLGNRLLWDHVLREPGMARIPAEVDLAERMHGLFDACAANHLFRENAYLHVLLTGRYAERGPWPLHLRPEAWEVLAGRVDRVRVVWGPLHAHLLAAEQHGRYDGFSLSDLSSYADDDTYAATWDGIRYAAAPGARVCERHFLAPRDPRGGPSFTRDGALEAELRASDDTFLYTFVVGRFQPGTVPA